MEHPAPNEKGRVTGNRPVHAAGNLQSVSTVKTPDSTKPKAPEQVLTFVHVFSRSLRCVARTKANPPASGEQIHFDLEWSAQPKPKHVATYRRWMLTVLQRLSERWQLRILYALGVAHNRTELWGFDPNQPPKLLERLNVGIP